MKNKGDFSSKLTDDGFQYLKSEIRYLLDNKMILAIPYALIYNSMKYFGIQIGKRSSKLPKSLNKKMSQHQYFWTQT